MIDLHSHPLPGLDDGPPDVAAALELVRAAAASGTATLVATPHVDGRWGVEPSAIAPAVDAMRAHIRRAGIEVELLAGAEVDLLRFSELDEPERALVRLGDGPYLLLETPHHPVPLFDELVLSLLTSGERIVLAHPERSPVFQRAPESVERLVEAGALVSITAAALSGDFGRTARQAAVDLLARNVVHSVASDAHDARRRPPGMTEGLAALGEELPGVEDLAPWLTEDVPRAILDGGAIPERPRRLERQSGGSWFSRLRRRGRPG